MLEELGDTETVGVVSVTVIEPELPEALAYVEALFVSGV
jgi:hypothetical protein